MKIKILFKGPNTVADTIKTAPIEIGHGISFTTELVKTDPSLTELKRLWEMESTFNELTKGRMHLDIIDE